MGAPQTPRHTCNKMIDRKEFLPLCGLSICTTFYFIQAHLPVVTTLAPGVLFRNPCSCLCIEVSSYSKVHGLQSYIKFFDPFWTNFTENEQYRSSFTLLNVDIHFFWHDLLKKSPFSNAFFPHLSWKSDVCSCEGLIWALGSILLIYYLLFF